MLVAWVTVVSGNVLVDLLCRDFALPRYIGKCQNLVSVSLNGAGFVNGDVSALHAKHALMGAQTSVYGKSVGLCTSNEKMNAKVFILTKTLDKSGSSLTVLVNTVAGGL